MNKKNTLLGNHHLLTLEVALTEKLIDLEGFMLFTNALLLKNELEKVGETPFVFENSSFTVAICLKESHICVHTWPEINSATLDVYLCNYSKDNSEKVKKLAAAFVSYFDAKINKQIVISR